LVDNRVIKLPDGLVDLGQRTVLRNETTVRLSSTEVRLLAYLEQRSGREVSREDLLVDVWEYAPTAATRTIDTTVRRLRKKIEADPSNPQVIQTVQGRGYRFVPAAGTTDAAAEVTHESDIFLGREHVVQWLLHTLTEAGIVVTILGPGGIGKSRLVQETVRQLPETRPSVTVALADLSPEEGVSLRVAEALEVRLHGGGDAEAQIRAVLDVNPMVIVLDAFEHVAECADEIATWLSPETQGAVVITSRIGLDLPGAKTRTLEPLSSEEAIALLTERAASVRPDFATEGNPTVLADLVKRLDHMPLAIELAAAKSRIMSAEEMIRRLDARRASGPGASRDGMVTSIEWSWAHLTDTERSVLARSTVFRGGFDDAAANAVLADAGEDITPVLASLVNQSLLRRFGAGPGRRYGLYDTIRQFAAAHSSVAEAAEAYRRHEDHYLARGRELHVAYIDGSRPAALELLRERDNLAFIRQSAGPLQRLEAVVYLAGLQTLIGLDHREISRLQMALSTLPEPRSPAVEALRCMAQLILARALKVVGRRADSMALCDQVGADPASAPDVALRARAEAAQIRVLQGDMDDAAAALDQILRDAVSNGCAHAEYSALEGLALLHRSRNERDRLTQTATRLLHLTEERGHTLWQPIAHMYLGLAAIWRNDLDGIRYHFEAAADGHEEIGVTGGMALAFAFGGNALAQVAVDPVTLAEADEWLDRAEAIKRRLGHTVGDTSLLLGRARVAIARGQIDEAREILQRSLRAVRAREHGPWTGLICLLSAGMAVVENDLLEAAELLDKGLAACTVIDLSPALESFRAAVRAAMGDLDGAEAAWATWATWATDYESPEIDAQIAVHRGHLELARGDVEAARACLAEARLIDAPPILALRLAEQWLSAAIARHSAGSATNR
jgi:predicted ATPase/DNA-binding winged helix-turn-helix (wHTH) protein